MGLLLCFAISCDKDDDKDGEKCVDADGNVYKTAIIGDQEWMAENLKTTTYNNGTDISNVTDDYEWEELATGAYAWHGNDSDNKDVYGALYNWYAVDTGNLCPDGWRMPTVDDWDQLTEYMGGRSVAGGKLKTTGTIELGTGLWHDPNTGATNEANFKALPGGQRDINGYFDFVGYYGFWWSATEIDTNDAWARYISNSDNDFDYRDSKKELGFSVRCLRD